MRSAVLHLGFEGLGAELAETAAFEDNPESQGVTRKLGYEPNGWSIKAREGKPAKLFAFHLTREAWLARRRDDVVIEALEPCLPLLGLAARQG
jgi:RimJ/RimL family protein N-acetyltransferase